MLAQAKAQFEKGTNMRKRVKAGMRRRQNKRGEREIREERGKINEERRARGGGIEKEGKRPRVISVHRLACTARCHVTRALHSP